MQFKVIATDKSGVSKSINVKADKEESVRKGLAARGYTIASVTPVEDVAPRSAEADIPAAQLAPQPERPSFIKRISKRQYMAMAMAGGVCVVVIGLFLLVHALQRPVKQPNADNETSSLVMSAIPARGDEPAEVAKVAPDAVAIQRTAKPPNADTGTSPLVKTAMPVRSEEHAVATRAEPVVSAPTGQVGAATISSASPQDADETKVLLAPNAEFQGLLTAKFISLDQGKTLQPCDIPVARVGNTKVTTNTGDVLKYKEITSSTDTTGKVGNMISFKNTNAVYYICHTPNDTVFLQVFHVDAKGKLVEQMRCIVVVE